MVCWLLELHERRERAHSEALDLCAQHSDLLRLLLREFDQAPPLHNLLVAARSVVELSEFRRCDHIRSDRFIWATTDLKLVHYQYTAVKKNTYR